MPKRRGILITRAEPDAGETAARVAALGFEPVVAPVLALRPISLRTRGRYDAVVITSRNAVPALPDWHKGLPLLAVGSATAAAARAAGFAEVLDADGNAAALLELAGRSLAPGARLLFVHGAGQGDAFAAAMQSRKFVVARRHGYAMRQVRRFPPAAEAVLRSGSLRSAMFLSAETARAFVRLLPETLQPFLAGVDAVAIGPAAAAALAPLPWHGVRVSVRPTLDEVLAQL